jgi:hypothetical protein
MTLPMPCSYITYTSLSIRPNQECNNIVQPDWHFMWSMNFFSPANLPSIIYVRVCEQQICSAINFWEDVPILEVLLLSGSCAIYKLFPWLIETTAHVWGIAKAFSYRHVYTQTSIVAVAELIYKFGLLFIDDVQPEYSLVPCVSVYRSLINQPFKINKAKCSWGLRMHLAKNTANKVANASLINKW